MPHIQVNDANFYYELHGQGQPLVLISGFTADHNAWLSVIDELAKNFQVLIFDNRGAGQTQDDDNPLSIELMADDIMALCEALGLKKPHILGHSMGGNIAQVIGAQYADKINRLVIEASTAKWRLAMTMTAEINTELLKSEIDPELLLDIRIPDAFGQSFLSNPENIRVLKQGVFNNPYPQSYADQRRQLDALMAFDGSKYLSKITASTLVLAGIEDMLSLQYESEHLVKNIQQAELKLVNCAHVIQNEAPGLFVDALKDFLI